MITIINKTNIPFKAEAGDQLNKKDNRRIVVTHGKMRIDSFIASAEAESFIKQVNGLRGNTEEPGKAHFKADTRLYFSNKEYQPIIVQSKTNNANFLLLAHALGEKERIVRTEFDSVFAVTRGFQKGKFIASAISFRVDRESFFRLTTTDGENVRVTTYTGKVDGTITEETKIIPVKEYKGFNLNERGTIKPYRPHKATHLVFTTSNQVEHAVKGNHMIELVSDIKSLEERIAYYKGFGFLAASFYVDEDRGAKLSGKEQAMLKLIQDNFRLTYLVTNDGFATDSSLKPVTKPVAQKKPIKTKPQHIKPAKAEKPKHNKQAPAKKQVRTNRAGIPVQ